jgi:quercetin dioxygenase-like cupin family protein
LHFTEKYVAVKGKKITNPVSRQTIEFLTTAKESNGQLLEMISAWEPHSVQPAPHFHPVQDEIFCVLEGELTLELNGEKRKLRCGESIHISANTVHCMWNESAEKVVAHWKVFPALQTEYFLETAMGLAADGKVGKNGVPGILQISLLAKKYKQEFRLQKPAFLLQQIVFCILAPLAILRGKKAVYPKYID